MAEQNDCEALRAQISALQAEFEKMWIAVSAGQTPPSQYRETRRQLDALRAQYSQTCEPKAEESTLPPHITADWRS